MTSPARVGEPAGRRGWAWWFVGIGVAALAARLYRIGAEPFWHDEAWTVTFSGKTQSEIWSWTPLDVGNPPLYYSILNAWRVLGDSEAVLRLPSVLIAVATLPVLYVTGRIVADRRSVSSRPPCSPCRHTRCATRRRREPTRGSPSSRRS